MSKAARFTVRAAILVLGSLTYWFYALTPIAYLFLASALGDCVDPQRCIRLENSWRGVVVYLGVAALLYVFGAAALIRRWLRKGLSDAR